MGIINIKVDNASIMRRLRLAKRQAREANKWDNLVDAIIDGRVIPVIGPDFLAEADEEEFRPINIHHELLTAICDSYKDNLESEPKTFSQLVHDEGYLDRTLENKEAIYTTINDGIEQLALNGILKPNRLLVKLLQTKLFPFVITTSFTPVVEMAMKEIWGKEEVRVLQFRNDSDRDKKKWIEGGDGDILSEKDLRVPTVYYMFGKYSNERGRYVVTDLDMMGFCKSWLAGTDVPETLYTELKKRYLLVLGNNYSDWLFRFIWYSIRDTSDKIQPSLILDEHLEPSLMNFLEQLQMFIEQDPKRMIDEIERRVNDRMPKARGRNNFRECTHDVFISYSRSDIETARKLRDALTASGLRVWFDKTSISGSAEWKDEIEKGISGSRLFIPLLSRNIEREYMKDHEYRVEWRKAAEVSERLGGVSYIWPFAEFGFDFQCKETKVPSVFNEKNASWYGSADDFKLYANQVAAKVLSIKQQEEKLSNGI